jgi:hypothetical protein
MRAIAASITTVVALDRGVTGTTLAIGGVSTGVLVWIALFAVQIRSLIVLRRMHVPRFPHSGRGCGVSRRGDGHVDGCVVMHIGPKDPGRRPDRGRTVAIDETPGFELGFSSDGDRPGRELITCGVDVRDLQPQTHR